MAESFHVVKGTSHPIYSIVIPVFRNEGTIQPLFRALELTVLELTERTEIILVIDALGDPSGPMIEKEILNSNLEIQVLQHSKNFGSFTAIRTGLKRARGQYVGVISADLQEPAHLLHSFFELLQTNSTDVVFGQRESRSESLFVRFWSGIYWKTYRLLINGEIPTGGIDVFACSRRVVNVINSMEERNSSLVGMLFWVGFRREFIKYSRLPRPNGKSAWSINRKFRYMSDSVFGFSNLPIRLIQLVGLIGVMFSMFYGSYLIILVLNDDVSIPGYAPLMLAIIFGNSACLTAIGLLGSYLWRVYENSQNRPNSIVINSDRD